MGTEEDIDKLLEEIPRATSAPPDFDPAYKLSFQGTPVPWTRPFASSFSDSCIHLASPSSQACSQTVAEQHYSRDEHRLLTALANLSLQDVSNPLQTSHGSTTAFADTASHLGTFISSPADIMSPFPPLFDEAFASPAGLQLNRPSKLQHGLSCYPSILPEFPFDCCLSPNASMSLSGSSMQPPRTPSYRVLPEKLQYQDGQLPTYIEQHKLELAYQAVHDRKGWEHMNSSLHGRFLGPVGHLCRIPAFRDTQGAMFRACGTGNACTDLYSQGNCGSCPMLHMQSPRDYTIPTLAEPREQDKFSKLFLDRTLQYPSLRDMGNHEDLASLVDQRRKDFFKFAHPIKNGEIRQPFSEKSTFPVHLQNERPLQQFLRLTSLEDLVGHIYDFAKDQHGCRFLQRKFDEGKPEDIEKIFVEIKDHMVDLMTDPFGNYLVQKLLDVCSESQRTGILEAVTKSDDFIAISLNMHGTRAVQKLIETLCTPEQISMLIAALKQGVVPLIKDLNGNHVIQRCLQHFSNNDSQFIFDAVAAHCVEIASHRHGCCVLQRCVDHASGVQRTHLVAGITLNALTLSMDPFGNYVVQYILELGLPWASAEVMSRLQGKYVQLSMQKFSSNVVERCLKVAVERQKECIVKELISSSVVSQLLQDPYANYVIQLALQVTKGPLHDSLIEAIRPHVSLLRSSPYGRRILSRTQFRK